LLLWDVSWTVQFATPEALGNHNNDERYDKNLESPMQWKTSKAL
jgi:hypothetical protein